MAPHREQELRDLLDPRDAVIAEMLSGSIEIVRCAVRHGYLDERLELTPKGLAMKQDGSGHIEGVQGRVVRCASDITAEVGFIRGAAATRCLEILGIDNSVFGALVERLANYQHPF